MINAIVLCVVLGKICDRRNISIDSQSRSVRASVSLNGLLSLEPNSSEWATIIGESIKTDYYYHSDYYVFTIITERQRYMDN